MSKKLESEIRMTKQRALRTIDSITYEEIRAMDTERLHEIIEHGSICSDGYLKAKKILKEREQEQDIQSSPLND